MPTEDDLRVALRDLERFTPDAADVLRAVYDHPQRPARSWRRPLRVPRRPALRAGLALGTVGALAAAAVIAGVVPRGPATTATPIAASALRTRLLAAIDTASGDILYTHGGPAPGGGTWLSPAYPQPGQKVHFRILGLGSDGLVYKDGEYSFTLPENEPPSGYVADFDQGGLQLSGTDLVVNHFRHVWGVWHGQFVLGFPLDAAGIRADIASGQFTVVGQTELHGQQAIEVRINVPPNHEAPPHTVAARLWVDARTYLPVQQYVRMSSGEQYVQEFTFLPPTPENLAKLRPVIPAGYTQVSGNSADLFGQKPTTCSAACPPKS